MFKIRLWFYWMVAGGVLIGTIVWLSGWGTQVSQDWATLQQNPTDASKKKFDASLEVVKAIVGGIGTIATIGGGFFVFRNVQLTQTRLTTERFSKAVEQLGSDKIEVRLGGIYALERIAQDSDRDHWTIMEVLTSFIQEKTSVKRIPEEKICAKAYEIWQQDSKDSADKQNWDSAMRELAAELVTKDIQAALTVVGQRDKKDPPDKRLNLSYANLIGANLVGANLVGTDFSYSTLSGANLGSANLVTANLSDAFLVAANLNGAFLIGASLMNANLMDADLSGANLINAKFRSAFLDGTNLVGANLGSAKNLTAEQLKGAKLCQTKLPDGIGLNSDRDCKELGVEPT
ncbi:MAG: pentapeptide repeat-containing protein [Phormidesmis sp. CAN_BIN44]|nr:pentapeptide repeat-containing protein [Phormidesmis sp. CAN_BIN44]